MELITPMKHVSIPLEQGGVFRPNAGYFVPTGKAVFQSLWNRAGSFDFLGRVMFGAFAWFQSLWSRAGSFDSRGGLVPCWIWLNIERFYPFSFLSLLQLR